MVSRDELLLSSLTARRSAEAVAEQRLFTGFCEQHQLAVDISAILLYLTSRSIASDKESGLAIQGRIARLDLAARMQGYAPWTRHPDLHRYLNGVHQDLPVGGAARSDPLYRENVIALLETTLSMTHEQSRDVAALLVAHDTEFRAPVLTALRWGSVRLTRATATIKPPPFGARGARPYRRLVCSTPAANCSVHALQALNRRTGRQNGLVFASQWGAVDRNHLNKVIRPVRDHVCKHGPDIGCDVLAAALDSLREPSPVRARDSALIALAYAVCLRSREASELRRKDVTLDRKGLIVDVPGRREPTFVGGDEDDLGAVEAWLRWQNRCSEDDAATSPAFPRIFGPRIGTGSIGPAGLNFIIQQRAEEARLRGTYTFTSLRVGHIRSLLRAGVPAHIIARQAGLNSLTSVARHDARENLLRDNVAARVGL